MISVIFIAVLIVAVALVFLPDQSGRVEDVPLPVDDGGPDTQTDILRKGYAPVETPTDEETRVVQAAWEKHVAGCAECREKRKLL